MVRMNVMKGKWPKETGFSVIELTLVIVIAMTLIAIGVPKLITYLRAPQIAADAKALGQQLALAKMRAAADFTQYQLNFGAVTSNNIVNNPGVCTPIAGSTGCYQMQLCNTKGAANTACTASNFVNEGPAVSLHPGVSFSWANVPSTRPAGGPSLSPAQGGQATVTQTSPITFNSRGVPIDSTNTPTANGAVYLADTYGRQYAVSVNSGGRILIQQYQGASTGWVIAP